MTTDTRNEKNCCAAIHERLTLYVLDDLDAGTQETIRMHLEGCADCRALEQQVRETLGAVQDALSAKPRQAVARTLTTERRQRVRKRFARRRLSVWTLVLQAPAMKIAASLMVGYLLISLLMPNMGQRQRHSSFSVSVVEPMPMEQLEELALEDAKDGFSYDLSGWDAPSGVDMALPSQERKSKELEEARVTETESRVVGYARVDMNGVAPVATPVIPPPAAAPRPPPPPRPASRGTLHAIDASDRALRGEKPPAEINVPLDFYHSGPTDALALPRETASVKPAEFDSVAQIRSPLVLQGIYGSRSPGSRGAALGQASPDLQDAGLSLPDDIAIEIVDAPVVGMPGGGRGNETDLRAGERERRRRSSETEAREQESMRRQEPGRAGFMLQNRVRGAADTFEIKDQDGDGFHELFGDAAVAEPSQSTVTVSGSEVPVIGDIPVVGRLFKGESASADVADRVVSRGDFLALAGGAAEMASEEPVERHMRFESRPDGPPAEWQGRLQEIRIPEINFRQAPVSDVVQFLNAQLLEYGQVGTAPLDASSIRGMALFPGIEGDQSLITFSAQDISALEALEIVAVIADLQWVKDGEKLHLRPRAAADGAPDRATPDPFAPRFKATGVNPFVAVAGNAFSTFSIDVDTASYTLARNYMLGGRLPPAEAVRTEEFVNFFDYAYEAPIADTFRVVAETAPSRFGRGLHMLKIGVKGRRLGREEQRPAALTFLVDSSGSMNQPDRLGLVSKALELLLDGLAETDLVAIIQFDSQARVILAHTPVSERARILEAVHAIQCGGGTNLEEGLLRAYEIAARGFVSRGENRILLMSDGVVNMGETASAAMFEKVEAYRRQGLYLSVFGVGMGIYDDDMLKTLASKGNGAYAFIDSEQEARRVFVDDLSATLHTIAEDVKIQVEYNPALVQSYRQLGYESRQLTREQFRDDTVDAGEVGSGQSVTALYELDLAASGPVAYAQSARQAPDDDRWLAVVRVRYRRVDTGRIEEIEQRIHVRDMAPSFDAASPRFRLAAGVAALAEILRGSPFVQGVEFSDVAEVLRPVALDLHLDGRIRELMQIVETAGGLAR